MPTILIIDDEPSITDVVAEVLADEGDTAAQLDLARRVADDAVFAEVSLATHAFGEDGATGDDSPRRGFGITVVPSESSDVLSAWQRARSLRDAAAQLDFEKAAVLRDQLLELRAEMDGKTKSTAKARR